MSQDLDAELQSRKQNKLQLRLNAEVAQAAQAAIVGGFALSMIPSGSDLEQPWRVLYLVGLAACGALNLFGMLTLGHVNWVGLHLLSASKDSIAAENDLFRDFWKHTSTRRGLLWSRQAIRLSVPLFLLSVVILVGSMTLLGAVLAAALFCPAFLVFYVHAATMDNYLLANTRTA